MAPGNDDPLVPPAQQIAEILKKIAPENEINRKAQTSDFANYAFVLSAILTIMSPYLQIALLELLKNRVIVSKDREFIDGKFREIERIFDELEDWVEKNKHAEKNKFTP